MSDIMLVFHFGCLFVICANDLSIFKMNLIRSQNFITVFAIFSHMWYLLKTIVVVVVTMYMTVVMVEARLISVSSWGLMMFRKQDRRCRWYPKIISAMVSALRMPLSPWVGCHYSWFRSIRIKFSDWAHPWMSGLCSSYKFLRIWHPLAPSPYGSYSTPIYDT